MQVSLLDNQAEDAAACAFLDDSDISPLASACIADSTAEFDEGLHAVKRLRNPDAAPGALKTLLALTDDENQCVFLGGNGAIEACSYILKRNRAAPDMQLHSIQILCNMVFDMPENQKRVREAGALDAIVLAMLHAPLVEDIQLYGIVALVNLSQDSDINCDAAVAAGAVEAIFAAVETFSENWKLIKQACAIFINLSRGRLIRQNRFRAAAGIPTLLSLLERPDSSETVTISTLVILSNLANGNEANQIAIGEPKAIQLILQLLHDGVKKKELGYRSCSLLRYLAFDEQNRDLIGQMGGLQSTMDFIRNYLSEKGMITRALKCLNNSVYGSNPNKTLICNSGAIQIVLSCMKTYFDDAELVGTCVRLLHNLVDGVLLNQKIFCDVGGPGQVAAAVELHRSNKDILDHAAGITEKVLEGNPSAVTNLGRLTMSVERLSGAIPSMKSSEEHHKRGRSPIDPRMTSGSHDDLLSSPPRTPLSMSPKHNRKSSIGNLAVGDGPEEEHGRLIRIVTPRLPKKWSSKVYSETGTKADSDQPRAIRRVSYRRREGSPGNDDEQPRPARRGSLKFFKERLEDLSKKVSLR